LYIQPFAISRPGVANRGVFYLWRGATMRSYPELRKILELWEAGHNKMQITKITGIPRATIRDCIDRYGSVERLDAVILRNEPPPTDAPLRLTPKKYVIPSYVSRSGGYSDEELAHAVANSPSIAEVLRKLNLRPAGGNYDIVQQRIRKAGLDTSHFTGKGWLKGKKNPVIRQRTLEEILVKDSTYTSTHKLRQRLIAEGIFQHQCVSCGLAEWLERPIPLEIDHINGDRRDHRLENLRLLCQNCHALTDNYRGKNKGGGSSL
jgi:5-methylcytosine-specific restriction endonuclease McrA